MAGSEENYIFNFVLFSSSFFFLLEGGTLKCGSVFSDYS